MDGPPILPSASACSLRHRERPPRRSFVLSKWVGKLAINILAFASIPSQVLKRCGDNLTRENIMKQARNLNNDNYDPILPGITVVTSPTDYSPFKQMKMMRFDGTRRTYFGSVVGIKLTEAAAVVGNLAMTSSSRSLAHDVPVLIAGGGPLAFRAANSNRAVFAPQFSHEGEGSGRNS
jgi:hypothetical protein